MMSDFEFESQEEWDFFVKLQNDLVWRVCVLCHAEFLGKPEYSICDQCADDNETIGKP